MKTLENIKLTDLMTDGVKSDYRARASADAVDPELQDVARNRGLPSLFARIDRLTGRQLDHIAAGFGLTTWRDTWPVKRKRLVAKALASQKMKMGTLSAVKAVLESLGAGVRVIEWFEQTPKGAPHTFNIIATLQSIAGSLDVQTQEDFFALLDLAKPVRAHYTFTISQAETGAIHLAGATRSLSATFITRY